MVMVMTMGLVSVTALMMAVIMIMSNSHMVIMHKCTERTAQIFRENLTEFCRQFTSESSLCDNVGH